MKLVDETLSDGWLTWIQHAMSKSPIQFWTPEIAATIGRLSAELLIDRPTAVVSPPAKSRKEDLTSGGLIHYFGGMTKNT